MVQNQSMFSWPKSTLAHHNADLHELTRPIAVELRKLKINTVRIDIAFQSANNYSAGDLNPHYEYIDEAITKIVEAGFSEIFCVFECTVDQTTYWKSFNGGNTWPHPQRPPASVVQVFKVNLKDTLNHAFSTWVSLGGDPNKFNAVVWNECYIGGAGSGNTPDGVSDFLEANDFGGYWDKASHWSSTWASLLNANGYSAHTSNIGVHDIFEIVVPYMFAECNEHIKFWLPAHGMEDWENEAETYMPAGYTWYTLSRWYDEHGRKRCTFNAYRGADSVWLVESKRGAAYNLEIHLDQCRSLIENYYDQLDEKIILLNTETGICVNYLTQHYGRRVGYAQVGRILFQFMQNMIANKKQFGFYTICGGEDIDNVSWSLIGPTGIPTNGCRVMMERLGFTGSVSPNGESYSAAANEPSTPVYTSSTE